MLFLHFNSPEGVHGAVCFSIFLSRLVSPFVALSLIPTFLPYGQPPYLAIFAQEGATAFQFQRLNNLAFNILGSEVHSGATGLIKPRRPPALPHTFLALLGGPRRVPATKYVNFYFHITFP